MTQTHLILLPFVPTGVSSGQGMAVVSFIILARGCPSGKSQKNCKIDLMWINCYLISQMLRRRVEDFLFFHLIFLNHHQSSSSWGGRAETMAVTAFPILSVIKSTDLLVHCYFSSRAELLMSCRYVILCFPWFLLPSVFSVRRFFFSPSSLRVCPKNCIGLFLLIFMKLCDRFLNR